MQPRHVDQTVEGPQATAATTPSAGLWRNRAFVRVWTASSISMFGSHITVMALPFAAIEVLDAGAFEVALVRSTSTSWQALLFGLVVGAWVDRLHVDARS